MLRFLRKFIRSDKGSVAPTVGLSIFALIAAGGLAFDYARVAAMDTELQNAADQAALAAATQLDGETGAQTRATSAAGTLVTNSTLFANEPASARSVGIFSVTFYSAYTNPSINTPATGDADSNFVQVQVNNRTANFAFTPIVAAISGTTNAKAVAGLSSAVCGVVPFFICNPTEPDGNTDVNLSPGGVNPGTGIVMAEGGTQWGPGNFGFLDQLGNGANSVAEALASDSLLGNCQPTQSVTTETGNILNAVRDSLNMRFDFKPGNAATCKSPPCSPSTNVTKDVVLPNTGSNCPWQLNPATGAEMASAAAPPRYFPPTPTTDLPTTTTPGIMGYPRDRCHYFKRTSGPNTFYDFCTYGRVGDGNWDRGAYFRSNHPGVDYTADPDLGPSVTRYQTYLWEADSTNINTRLPTAGKNGNGAFTAFGQPSNRCLAPGLAPDPAGIDRRRITAAVVNCKRVAATTGLNGKKTIPVAGFIDVFLVEPSFDRTRCDGCSSIAYGGKNYDNAYGSRNDIYIEVIGASGTGEGGAIPQISRRDVPRLIE
jgi:Flp pilus assembly protein TadG